MDSWVTCILIHKTARRDSTSISSEHNVLKSHSDWNSLGNCANCKPLMKRWHSRISCANQGHPLGQVRPIPSKSQRWEWREGIRSKRKFRLLLHKGRGIDAGQPITGIHYKHFQSLFHIHSFRKKCKILSNPKLHILSACKLTHF